MPTRQEVSFCPTCNRMMVHLHQEPSQLAHLLLVLMTLGFWLPGWLFLMWKSRTGQCTGCGERHFVPKR